MKRIIVCLILVALPLTSYAGGHTPKHCPIKPVASNPTSNAQSGSLAAAASLSTANSSSNSGATSNAQGGHASATGGKASSNANSSNTNTNTSAGGDASGQTATTTIDERMPRQTPPAFAGTVQPTASCKNAINGGASAPMAGLAFGFGKGDEECDLRETAREFYEMGQPELAVALLCQSKAAKKLATCQPRTTPVVAMVTDDVVYTRAQVSDIVRKAVSK